jgi:hypothetical protein
MSQAADPKPMSVEDVKKLLSGKPDPKARAAVLAALGEPKKPKAKPADVDKAVALDALYSEAAAEIPYCTVAKLKDQYGHYNPGMQKMQLTAAIKKHKSGTGTGSKYTGATK